MNSNKFYYTLVSLLCSAATIIAVFSINIEVANRYLTSSGKTRALFGLFELSYLYKYNWLASAVAALILAVAAIKKKESKPLAITSIIAAVVAVLIVFIPLCKLMVP